MDANARSRNPAYIREYVAKVAFAVDRRHETSCLLHPRCDHRWGAQICDWPLLGHRIGLAKWDQVDSLETLLGFDETEYLALFLWLAIAGAGRFSIDRLLNRPVRA